MTTNHDITPGLAAALARLREGGQAPLARWVTQQVRSAAWASRLDAQCYTARRFGDGWLAENEAAGQLFEFSRGELPGTVACTSHSGGRYLLAQEDGEWTCSCRAAEGQGGRGCKHSAGAGAVVREFRREQVRRELAKVQAPARMEAANEERKAA